MIPILIQALWDQRANSSTDSEDGKKEDDRVDLYLKIKLFWMISSWIAQEIYELDMQSWLMGLRKHCKY